LLREARERAARELEAYRAQQTGAPSPQLPRDQPNVAQGRPHV
jgi:hypothetical protein